MTESVKQSQRHYLPAAGHDLLLPLYDIVTKLMGADRARVALLDQAELKCGQRILEIGCGTGTLAVLIKQRFPEVEVIGLDPDPKALARARRKAERSAVSVEFDEGYSEALDYPDRSFDHVFSAYMFHHLGNEQKEETMRAIKRVLKAGACLHLLDFGGADSADAGHLPRLFHTHKQLKDNSEDRVLTLMTQAGLVDAKTVARSTVLFGLAHVAYYKAAAPGS